MTNYEDRLMNYATQPGVLRKSKGKDGLTGKQRRRLLHKENHQTARSTEGETT